MYTTLNNSKYYAYTATREHQNQQHTIVFVHGTSMDHTVWSHQSRYFAYHGYNVLAVDLPGHQLSGGKLLGDIESMADWLNQMMNQCINKNIHLIGHSMGSLICLQAASQLINSVIQLKSLTLVGFGYPMAVSSQLQEAAKNDPNQAYSMMTQWSHHSLIGGEPIPGFWSPGMQMSMMQSSHKASVYTDLMACDNYKNGESAFDKVFCPILFLSGRKDKMTPAKLAKKHADKNPLATIKLIGNCGHSILSESPDEVLNELKNFISTYSQN